MKALLPLIGLTCCAMSASAQSLCTAAFYEQVDEQLQTDDGQGHGPDVGSAEWKGVVEFKLGIRGRADLPPRNSEAWCAHVAKLLDGGDDARRAQPSFDCTQAQGSIEELICADGELAGLDQKLSTVYAEASAVAENERPPMLKSEQRGWVKGRNECWRADDKRSCVQASYIERIAELQAKYRLVDIRGPVFYWCDGNRAKEVVASYFTTVPPTLIAEFGDSSSLMYLRDSGNGRQYQGRNESLREDGDEVVVVWGYQAPEMRCQKAS